MFCLCDEDGEWILQLQYSTFEGQTKCPHLFSQRSHMSSQINTRSFFCSLLIASVQLTPYSFTLKYIKRQLCVDTNLLSVAPHPAPNDITVPKYKNCQPYPQLHTHYAENC